MTRCTLCSDVDVCVARALCFRALDRDKVRFVEFVMARELGGSERLKQVNSRISQS